jgi:hypothetical protein
VQRRNPSDEEWKGSVSEREMKRFM